MRTRSRAVPSQRSQQRERWDFAAEPQPGDSADAPGAVLLANHFEMPACRHGTRRGGRHRAARDLDLACIVGEGARIEREKRVRFDAVASREGVEGAVDSVAPFAGTVQATHMNGGAFTEAVLRCGDIARHHGRNELLDPSLRMFARRDHAPGEHGGKHSRDQGSGGARDQTQ